MGIALAALMVTMVSRLEKRLEMRLDRIETTQTDHGERLARVEGALEIIRTIFCSN